MSLTVLDMAKESSSGLEHTVMTVEDNIGVKNNIQRNLK